MCDACARQKRRSFRASVLFAVSSILADRGIWISPDLDLGGDHLQLRRPCVAVKHDGSVELWSKIQPRTQLDPLCEVLLRLQRGAGLAYQQTWCICTPLGIDTMAWLVLLKPWLVW